MKRLISWKACLVSALKVAEPVYIKRCTSALDSTMRASHVRKWLTRSVRQDFDCSGKYQASDRDKIP